MLSRGKLIGLGAFIVLILGFVVIKTPTPVIVIAPEDIVDLGGYTVTNTILSAWVVMAFLIGLTFFLYRRLRNVEEALVPRGFQNVIEALLEAFQDIVELVAGEKNGRRFFPMIATIFLVLLFANWFGLFPWNNVIGKTVDARAEYLEELEVNAEEVVAELHDGASLIAPSAVNGAFGDFFLEPIPIEAGEQEEANTQIEAVLEGEVSLLEAAVRAEFREDPIAASLPAGELVEAIEERLVSAGVAQAELEEALLLNLPLPTSSVDSLDLEATIFNRGGVNTVPIKAEDFEFNPFTENLVIDGNGGFSNARLYDRTAEIDAENQPAGAGEVTIGVTTINMAHVGIVLKREKEGLEASEGLGHLFPFFRAIATDLNLPLAIALWSLIFVQLWGIQSLGVRNNFGKFIGVGSAAVVKGPIGVMVGFLEIISEIARIVSFTFRLFGNIFAGEILLFMAAFLVPLLVATVFYGLEVFVGFIQAFVFAMLTLVFAVTAVSHGEHEEEDESEQEAAGH